MAAMDAKPSISEDNGIAALSDQDLVVYSVGISTGGAAEVRMAQAKPERKIIATTIDVEGASLAEAEIKKQGFGAQIEVRVEDVAKPLPYPNGNFDFIYARLVLHYLSKQDLEKSLVELHRVLKKGGRIFVVVRSVLCNDAKAPNAVFDPETHLTTWTRIRQDTGKPHTNTRYFHSEESISSSVKRAGFTVLYVKSYREQLYGGFMRSRLSSSVDHLIELTAEK
jgi:ubiquinone/menaquinone biosynthesis C-methylase UbiE